MSMRSYEHVKIERLGFEGEVDLFFVCVCVCVCVAFAMMLPSSPLDCEVRC